MTTYYLYYTCALLHWSCLALYWPCTHRIQGTFSLYAEYGVVCSCRVCTYMFFQRRKNSDLHCFSPHRSLPGRWRFFSRLAMRIEGQNGARLGFLECCSVCVQAGRDLPVDWLSIYGEGDGDWGGMFVGKCKTHRHELRDNALGSAKNTAPLSSSVQMSIHTLPLYPACKCVHTLVYYAACVVFIHSRSRFSTVVSILLHV